MSICLCGQSAEKVLDLIALKRMEHSGRAGKAAFDTCRAGKKELHAALELLPELENPIQLVVPSQELRVCDDIHNTRVWSGALPEKSLVMLSPGVYSASPEFNALLEMRGKTRIGRALALMGYCGIFAIDESSEDGFINRPQLTSVERLRSYAREIRLEHSSHVLSDTTGLALERARSPLEARLALALTLPCGMGGFGIARPELNTYIELGKEAQAILGRSWAEPDLLWPDAKVVLEANGRLRHDGKFGDDLTKASALEADGYAVRFVTSKQLRSPRQMMVLGSWLAEKLGVTKAFPKRELLEGLLGDIMSFEYHHTSL